MNGHQVGGRGLVLYASPEGDVMGRAAIEPSTKVGATVSNPPILLSNKTVALKSKGSDTTL